MTFGVGATSVGDDALFEELRALRKQLADAGNIAPYMVFSDRALRDMCARRPKDALDFLEVNGVGSRSLSAMVKRSSTPLRNSRRGVGTIEPLSGGCLPRPSRCPRRAIVRFAHYAPAWRRFV